MQRYFYLTPMLGGPGAPRYPIDERAQYIGRSEQVDISLFEPTVSRQHATIQILDNMVVLKDLGSKHGTFVNSKRVSTIKLKVGDIVVFGLSLVLRLEAAEKPVSPPEPLKVPSQMDEYGESREDPSVTAIRSMTTPRVSSKRKRPTESVVVEMNRSQTHLAQFHKMAGAGAFCITLLPQVKARLVELRATLDRLLEEGKKIDPAFVLSAVDDTLIQITRMTEATAAVPKQYLEVTSLADVVQQSLALVKSEVTFRQVEFMADVAPDLMVKADPQRLIAAVTEILRNAAQFSPDGTLVEVMATSGPKETILAISDQGKGFSQEVLDRLFDPFVTRTEDLEALGLGLFQANQIVMSFGGTLSIKSKPNVGSTVRLLLPPFEI
jgi:pSer/pThr/pTyr-binding forkhead associated (FHA) protein/anti-sigma regulatory factor (Ser/Thr protein kinase)